MNMCINPEFKSVDKAKWATSKGMSYEGQTSQHVSSLRRSLLGGTGLANATITGNKAKKNRGGSWSITKNEEDQGVNPYAGSHEDMADTIMSRKRNIEKERQISPVAFSSIVRNQKIYDDRLKAKTLNQYNGEKLEAMMQIPTHSSKQHSYMHTGLDQQ